MMTAEVLMPVRIEGDAVLQAEARPVDARQVLVELHRDAVVARENCGGMIA